MADINFHLSEVSGLGEKEAKIYLALLSLGYATVIEIAKKTGIKRSTVYNLLPTMIDNGLISIAKKKKRKLFFIEDVKNLRRQLAEREERMNLLLPELESLHNLSPLKPKINYYEGTGGLREILNDTLESCRPGDFTLSFIGVNYFDTALPRGVAKNYIAKRVKMKIRTRVISAASSAMLELQKTAREELREIKIVKDLPFNFTATMEIYANKVALISFKEGFIGVIIESKEIHAMLKTAFELMWQLLK